MPTIVWHCYIDWNADGDFSDTSEDVGFLMRDLIIKRGRDFFLSSEGSSFEPVPPGELTVKLDNQDDRFNPYNTGSVIYPNVTPGKKIKITAVYDSNTYNLYTGYIKDIQPSGLDDKIVTITALDTLQWMIDNSSDYNIQQNQLVFDCIYWGLFSMGWGYGMSIDNNTDRLPWFYLSSDSVYDSYMELASAFMGKLFVAYDGSLLYYSRNHVYTSAYSIDQSECLRDIPLPQPWEVVRNRIRVNTYAHNVATSHEEVWNLGGSPVYIGAGSSVTLYAQFNPCWDLQPSAWAAGDFEFWQYSDGTGDDLHTAISISWTVKAKSAKMVISNTGGTAGYMTFMRIRAKPVFCDQPTTVEKEDTTSQSKYQLKAMYVDSVYIQNAYFASDYALYNLSKLKNPTKYPVIYLENQFTKQLPADLFTAINFTSTKLGISTTQFLISSIEHTWLHENGQAVRTKFTLELPYELHDGYWIFSTNIGTTSYFAF